MPKSQAVLLVVRPLESWTPTIPSVVRLVAPSVVLSAAPLVAVSVRRFQVRLPVALLLALRFQVPLLRLLAIN